MADLTCERFHTAVDVLMLFQATGGRETLAAFDAGVRMRTCGGGGMHLPDVTLEVGVVPKHFAATLAWESMNVNDCCRLLWLINRERHKKMENNFF